MGACGNLWKPVETCGNQWKTYGNWWEPVETYGNLWKPMENLWKPMATYGITLPTPGAGIACKTNDPETSAITLEGQNPFKNQ